MVTGRNPILIPYPYIDGLTPRQQEQIYLDFEALAAANKGSRWRTISIAASDSSAASRRGADYLCSGVNDDITINAAISAMEARAAGAHLGRIVLLEGTYFLTNPITISTLGGRVLAIEGMAGNAQSELSVTGTQITLSGGALKAFDINGAGGDVGSTVILENLSVTSASSAATIASRDMTLMVRQCRIINSGTGGGISQTNSTGGSSNTIVDGNYVNVAGGTGISIVAGPTRATVSAVRNNTVTVSGSSTNGITTGNDVSSLPEYHISDNTVSGGGTGGTGVGISTNGTSTEHNIVSDNHVAQFSIGIQLAGYRNICANNLIERVASGIKDGAFQLDASFIVGNHIVDATSVGISIGTQNCAKNGILGNKVVGYTLTVPVACQINGLATNTHVYYNDFDTSVTTPIVDTGTGTASQSGIPSGGTTGQILAKKSSGAGDVQWVDDDVKATITAMGDLIVGLSAGTYTALHTAGSLAMGPSWSERILVTDSSTSPAGVKWGPLVTVGNVAPTSPRPGDIWMDTT